MTIEIKRTQTWFQTAILASVVFALVWTSPSLAQDTQIPQNDTLIVCFLSDTQEPMWFERLYLGYHNNAEARKKIFRKVLDLQPDAVYHLGDMVSSSFNKKGWEELDEFVSALSKQGGDFYPIAGNHEYIFFSGAIKNFTSRYPDASLTGYATQLGNLAVVLFNSNFGKLSEAERDSQLVSYNSTLQQYDADSTVDFVLVGCHHSPYTNSKIVSGSEEVQQDFLPGFYSSNKAKVFLGGHAHAYERFHINEKDFLVIGGGGGSRQPLRVGEDAEYKDLFSNSLEIRTFHFVVVTVTTDSLAVDLHMLNPDFKMFEVTRQLEFGRGKLWER
ncbi:MAG: metallophosphoesterase [Ignavibacteriae bacterium]|nr:metallophosphoesterase [Ignavibacteriota bacterium]